jgi:hypothetical protein
MKVRKRGDLVAQNPWVQGGDWQLVEEVCFWSGLWGKSCRGPYLKAGIVVIRVLGFPHLNFHSWLLHELAGSQGHGPQHVLSAALEHLLQNLAGHR